MNKVQELETNLVHKNLLNFLQGNNRDEHAATQIQEASPYK